MVKKVWFKEMAVADIMSLGLLEPIGPITWQRIFKKVPSGQELLKMGEKGWRAFGLAAAQVTSLANRPTNLAAAERLLKSKNIQLITIEDKNYPPLLKEISDPPLWLYYRGDIQAAHQKSVTIVGSRKPTSYALSALRSLISNQLAASVVIASGLAYGIDKAAHELSLKASGKTIAVLAGGLDSIYPADHHRLADQIIASGGVLVSEYPPLDRPKPWKFPVRNRILAGLSPATIVIEARIKSGSLTTAKSAIDYNRDLFAVPGDIIRSQAEGTNFLIKRGASLLDDASDLETYYGLKKTGRAVENIDEDLKTYVRLIASEPKTIDQLTELANQPIETVLGAITQLELIGLIGQDDTGRYCLKK